MSNKTKHLQKRIIKWYQVNERDFPWRNTTDPYKIMIAEFMLHRTKAEQVVPVYLEFIKKYPDIETLSTAKSNDIIKLTAGLGLHWRSKHFIESVKYIIGRHNRKFPEDYDDLRKIPGVGEYTAGVITTVCFKRPAPVVDSNIARFINRYWNLKLKGEIRRKKAVIDIAMELFTCDKTEKFLFALIDFTALICKPRQPECIKCFLKSTCKWYSSNPVN